MFLSRSYLVLGLVLSVTAAPSTHAATLFETTYSFSQTGTTNFGNTVPPAPIDRVQTETTPISSYGFDVRTVPSSPTELKASTRFTVDIDQRGSTGVSWSSLDVSARAKSTLVDLGFVQGAGGVAGGLLEFSWVVTGLSNILLDATGPNALLVRDLTTQAIFSSNIPGAVPELFVNDQADDQLLSGTGLMPTIESQDPYATAVQSFFVPWTGGTEVPIFFELDVSANLDVQNLDAAGFSADIGADFSNTATLRAVTVRDASGNVVSGASFIGQDGFDYSAVPEPSSGILLGFALAGLGRRARQAGSAA